MQLITTVTRRDLRSVLGRTWRGRLNEDEFLSRLYDLTTLPSTDPNRENMLDDVRHHTSPLSVLDGLWADDWIFDDPRLGLDDHACLLRLLAETLHPEVVGDGVDVNARFEKLNKVLLPDGFELFVASAMSGRPIFSWRRTVPRKPPTGDFPSSLIAGMSEIFPEIAMTTGIDSMFEAEDFPRPENLALNKEGKVKAWLRTAQGDPAFEHWDGLARVLRSIFEDPNSFRDEAKTKIRAVLAKRGITYLDGGMLTTAPQSELASLPASSLMPREKWIEIGSGGFGVVYRLTDPRLEIDFALKVFEPYPGLSYADARARFMREAGLLFRLRHENVVRVYDAGELPDGRPFIKMEFFDGFNLYKAREQRGFSTKDVVTIVGKLVAAVEHAHSRSIIHRDIKPSNILLSNNNDVRLIDFGLGILVEEAVNRARLTKTAQQFGDAYTAPELLENAKTTDPAVDMYSVGAVWFWLHAGQAPRGIGLNDMINGFGLAPDVRNLLHTCLLPSPKQRPTAKALLDDLSGVRQGESYFEGPDRAAVVSQTPSGFPSQGVVNQLGELVPPLLGEQPEEHTDGEPVAAATKPVPPPRPAPLATAGSATTLLPGGPIDPKPEPAVADVSRKGGRNQRWRWIVLGPLVVSLLIVLIVYGVLGRKVSLAIPAVDAVVPSDALSGDALDSPVDARLVRDALSPCGVPGTGCIPRVDAQLALDAPPPADASPPDAPPPPPPMNCPDKPDKMVPVPEGVFLMGSPENVVEKYKNENEQHQVTLSAYCIDKMEVTVEEYAKCVTAKKCLPAFNTVNVNSVVPQAFVNVLNEVCKEDNDPNHPNYPITCIDWYQAQTYCKSFGKRLPTEAEWEYAARGEKGRVFPWGDKPLPDKDHLNACGPECPALNEKGPKTTKFKIADKWKTTAPVGSFPKGASQFGALDMAGNVWEWTADWYAPRYSKEPVLNPTGPTDPGPNRWRVIRGGGWNNTDPDDLHAAIRSATGPDGRTTDTGFRCAWSPIKREAPGPKGSQSSSP